MSEKKIVESRVVLKSGIWYTVSNFAFRAIAFITTPIFTRVLTKSEYGSYNSIHSWVSILIVLAACDLHSSIIRAKLDFEDDLESYALSSLTLSSIITIIFYFTSLLFENSLEVLFGFDKKYFHIIFLYILCNEAFYSFVTLERAQYRYKTFSLLTGISIALTSIFSVILVLVLNNKLDARVYGQYIPIVLIGICMYGLIIRKGKKINFGYYKYALTLSLPLVPHQLSLILLSSSDRIMITNLVGAEFTALYSIAYIITNIIAILLDSMNKAWAPWLLGSLKAKHLGDVKKTTSMYFLFFFGLIIGALIFSPEAVLILGGRKYVEGIYVLPPLIIGCLFQFSYTMYVQLEFYEKKMKTIAVGSAIAAVINIALNYILIPMFGYVAAGYTTLIGYAVLFVIHYWTICRYGYKNIFDRKLIFAVLAGSLVLIPLFLILYSLNVVRYIIGGIYIIALSIAIIKKRKNILCYFLGGKSNEK